MLISTKITGSDSKYSSQVFLKIKRETDLSTLEIFMAHKSHFPSAKQRAVMEISRPVWPSLKVRLVCFVHQSQPFQLCTSFSAGVQIPSQGMELKEENEVGGSHFWGSSHPKPPHHPLQLLLPSITPPGKDTQLLGKQGTSDPGIKAGWGALTQIPAQQSVKKRRKISPK